MLCISKASSIPYPSNHNPLKCRKKEITFCPIHLQLCQKTLALQEQDNLVNRCPDVGGGQINSQVSIGGHLVRVIDTGETLNLTSARLGVHTTLVSLLGVLERGGNVDEVERSVALDSLAGGLS
jgi:hypothetical protein